MTNKMMTLKGIEKVVDNINKQLNQEVNQLTESGLIKVAILIRNSMAKESPLIPIDLGNLNASWYVITKRVKNTNSNFTADGSKYLQSDHSIVTSKASSIVETSAVPTVIMGFSARYAMPVHEGLSSKGKPFNYIRPQAGAKFLESALWRNKDKIVEIMSKEIKAL